MATTAPGLMAIALAAHDAGMSIIPIRNDGHKKPAVQWKQYQTERATKEQVRAWFAPGHHQAAAVVCGEVSGWLVMIEMEGWAFADGLWEREFRPAIVAVLGEERWGQITSYVEESPSGGIHIYVRCPDYRIGNVKLAMREGVVAMETRGEGGYSVIAGSVGHATGNGWTVARGEALTDVVTVTHDEMDAILAAARTLHEAPEIPEIVRDESPAEIPSSPTTSSSDRWMDATIEDFNATTNVLTWLSGWEYRETETYNGESVMRLHRSGSDNEHGALIFESGRVAFFSSNCPHWAKPYDGYGHPETYDAFTVMMHEEKGTNDTQARVATAKELRTQGFGPPIPTHETLPCVWCGKPFKNEIGRVGRPRKYCSQTCRQVMYNARERGIEVTLAEVAQRTHWKCGICDGRVNQFDKSGPHRASLDHIVPRSKGGSEEGSNLQLAHLRCNITKNARDEGTFTVERYDAWEEMGILVAGFGEEDPLERHSDVSAVDPEEGETEGPTPLRIRWVDEAIANPPPEPEVLVTGLLRRGEVTVLGAPRAIGKTWASLNLANICSRGEGQLFGSAVYKATTPARVLYLQGELGEWGSASRWAALPNETPEHMVAEVFDRLRIRTTNRSVTTVSEGTTYHDSHTDAVVDWRLEPLISEHDIDVLIIDPWATFFAGNENNNDETEAAITALIDIARRQDIAVFIVHHISNKTDRGNNAEPEDLWRGASRLADAVSTRMTVLPYFTEKAAAEIGMARMEARKHVKVTTLERNGPSPEMIYSKRDAYWWNAWTPPEVGRPAEVAVKDVVRVLRDQPGKAVPSGRRLGALLDKSHGAIERVVELAIAQGLVEEMPGPRNAVGYRLVADL